MVQLTLTLRASRTYTIATAEATHAFMLRTALNVRLFNQTLEEYRIF